jgi:NAD(P)H dehydrogenase (quinone)
VLAKMHALGTKGTYPIVSASDLPQYDGILFGIPTRFGNFPAQLQVCNRSTLVFRLKLTMDDFQAFIDTTGSLWQTGGLNGKFAGLFVSTGTLGGGQETTAINALSTLAHHGMIYVPLGYSSAFRNLANVNEVRGGSPWGAGTFAVCSDVALAGPQ